MAVNLTIYALSDRLVDDELIDRITPDDTDVHMLDRSVMAVWPEASVRITDMAPEALPQHLEGMAGFMTARVGGDADSIAPVLATVRQVKHAYGFVIEPDIDDTHRVMSLVISLTATLEQAFIFANGMFYDAFGRMWFGDQAAGPLADLSQLQVTKVPMPVEASAEQAARTERVLATLNDKAVPCFTGHIRWIPDESTVMVRPAAEVAQRVVALHSIVTLARGRPRDEVANDLNRFGLLTSLSPGEAAFMAADPVDEDGRQRLIWRLEALVPLMWALGFIDELSWPDAMVDVEALHELIFTSLPDPAAVQAATLRPEADLLDALELTVRQHNALRGCYTSNSAVPTNFDWKFPGDVTPAQASLAAPLLLERHHALNWLIGFGGAAWDDVDTPT